MPASQMLYLLQLCPLLTVSSSSFASQNVEVSVSLGVGGDSRLPLLCKSCLERVSDWTQRPRNCCCALLLCKVGFINFMKDVEGHHDTW